MLAPGEFENLFRAVRGLEARMNLNPRSFSLEEQTIEGASVLARSPYYREWRAEVNRIFERIHGSALAEEQSRMAGLRRLLFLSFPAVLPVAAVDVLKRWPDAQIKRVNLSGGPSSLLDAVLGVQQQSGLPRVSSFLEEFALRPERGLGDVWLIEAGTTLERLLPELARESQRERAVRLSFSALKPLRDAFVDQIKSMRKTLADADTIMRRLRSLDISALCPQEIGATPAVREFVRALFLTNNGSQLFSNAFVEWGITQAAAHARPRVVLGEFGLRDKPKPFTSVAIFEDPARANPLPSQPDPEGSAVDAGMLAYYAWLGMRRYPECRTTGCVCLLESARCLLVTGPPDFPLLQEQEPIPAGRIGSLLRSWLA